MKAKRKNRRWTIEEAFKLSKEMHKGRKFFAWEPLRKDDPVFIRFSKKYGITLNSVYMAGVHLHAYNYGKNWADDGLDCIISSSTAIKEGFLLFSRWKIERGNELYKRSQV